MAIFKNIFQSKKQEEENPPIETGDLVNLDADGRGMVRGIVELSETPVKEAMIPRIDTVFVAEKSDTDESIARVMDSGHSRFPVYRETIDNVIGILYVKDLLGFLIKGENISIPEVLRPAYFVPESMKLDSLLKEMKQRRVHIAIAVDEYGGVSGIISMEDILEEIVGDIQDEFDNEGEELVSVGENEWICDARMNLEDLNDELGVHIPADDFDSLGGFVFDLFGKIPGRYEKVKWGKLFFIIQSVDGYKIKQVKIIKENAES
ncbi:MAG: magnesium/cobalt efflux protein [Spirochaetes bacterium]|nr:MAG: magnesium/cobalt efflux protein [Spirochaetota bacterium]RKX96463.1 MAG: magnesium/cobalt efflux protein [Spirochaetota bacterium]